MKYTIASTPQGVRFSFQATNQEDYKTSLPLVEKLGMLFGPGGYVIFESLLKNGVAHCSSLERAEKAKMLLEEYGFEVQTEYPPAQSLQDIHVVTTLRAPNDTYGNPRTVYIVHLLAGKYSGRVAILDMEYGGTGVVTDIFPNAIFTASVEITAAEYKRWMAIKKAGENE